MSGQDQVKAICRDIGEIVKQERLRRNLTVTEMAYELDISANELYSVTAGKRRLRTMLKYMNALGYEVDIKLSAHKRSADA